MIILLTVTAMFDEINYGCRCHRTTSYTTTVHCFEVSSLFTVNGWKLQQALMAVDRMEFLKSTLSMPLLVAPSSSLILSTLPINTDQQHDKRRGQPTQTDILSMRSQSQKFRQLVNAKVRHDPTMAGKFIRLAFHDAATLEVPPRFLSLGSNNKNNINKSTARTTGGPNGSIQYELNDRYENRGLKAPLEEVKGMRSSMLLQNTNTNNYEPTSISTPDDFVLSLADCIALAGAEAVEAVGGPKIPIRLGRSDVNDDVGGDPRYRRYPPVPRSIQPTERSYVTTTLPSPGLDSDGLRTYFSTIHHLTDDEWVALCGSHGLGRHVSLLNMTKQCLRQDYQTISPESLECLEAAPVSLPFVTSSVDRFDKTPLYFESLLRWNKRQVSLGEVAFIPTDVALVVDKGLRRYVEVFAKTQIDYAKTLSNKDESLSTTTTTTTTRSPINDSLYYKAFTRGYQKLVDSTATTSALY